jgi:hypothetical protein
MEERKQSNGDHHDLLDMLLSAKYEDGLRWMKINW